MKKWHDSSPRSEVSEPRKATRPQATGTWDMGQGPGSHGTGTWIQGPWSWWHSGNLIRNLDAVGHDFLHGMCAHMWKHDDNMFLPSWNCGTCPSKGFGKSGEKEKGREKRSQGTQAGLTPSLLRHTWGSLKKSGALRPWNGPQGIERSSHHHQLPTLWTVGPAGWARAVGRVSGLHSLMKNTASGGKRESHSRIPVIVQQSLCARHRTWCWNRLFSFKWASGDENRHAHTMCIIYICISYIINRSNIQLCINNLFLDGAKCVQRECSGTRRGVQGWLGKDGNTEKEPGMLRSEARLLQASSSFFSSLPPFLPLPAESKQDFCLF